MKQKDIIAIIAVVVVSGFFAFIICSKFVFTSKDRQQKAEVIAPITSEFNLPDKKIFNENAVNPTQLIQIGQSANNQPFAK